MEHTITTVEEYRIHHSWFQHTVLSLSWEETNDNAVFLKYPSKIIPE
jgi:hypothetical protein